MAGLNIDLSGVVNDAINQKMAEFDIEGQIKTLLGDVAKQSSKVLTVKLDGEDGEGKRFPLVHKQFEQLLAVGAIPKMNPLLTGGAGLSKTTAVEQFAEALGLDFKSISFSNGTTKTDLYGYMDANGRYVSSGFVDAFEHGKVFLADEIDACASNTLVLLNSALDNGFLTTPENRTIYAHKNFRIVATANTNLNGSKDGFTARNKLDSASRNRFSFINWELDEELEQKITNNDGWLKIVRKARKNAENGLEGFVVTPRSSYKGSTMLNAGLNVDAVIDMVVCMGCSEDEKSVLLKGITENMKSQAVKNAGHKRVIEPEAVETVDEAPIDEIDDEDVVTFMEQTGHKDDEDEEFGTW